MKDLWKLYRVFFSIGICTFGGGYAMLSLLQRVIVEKYHWASEEELPAISGIDGLRFCHAGRFLITAATEEEAVEACRAAMEAEEE